MKNYIKAWWKAIPFAVGVALTLIALCFLVRFYDYGLDFAEQYIWLFGLFFLLGFPMIVFGVNQLAAERGQQ